MDGSRNRRVLFLATVYSHLAHFHLPFLELLQSAGFEVHAAAAPDHLRPAVAAVADQVWDLPFSRRPLHPTNVLALARMVRLLSAQDYALVHVHTPVAAALGRIAAAVQGTRPVVYTAHGFHFWEGAPVQNWMLYFPMEWMLARLTDGLITINPEDQARASTFPVRPGGRVYRTSGVGVDLGEPVSTMAASASLMRLRGDLDVPPGSPVVLSVGELNANKNQRQVLRSMTSVVQRHPDVRWLVAGEGGERSLLEAEARALGLAQHVRFLGFRRDVRDLVLVSDLLVSTSRREGLPLNVLEAMAASRPVVVSETRGHRDLVTHGVNGLVVGLDDHDATSAAMLRLLDNPGEAAAMGRAGYRTAQAYSRAVVREQMRGIYNQILAEHGRESNSRERARARGAYDGRD